MQFTFKELLEKHNVVIPQLQRDYAQGRDNEGDLRKVFISNIKSVLQEEGKQLNLDFIYGYTEPAGRGREVFIPLDGQQRLTTLWLIHWYLSPREKEQIDDEVLYILSPQTAEYLQNFTYQTRISSKRFCACLISEPLDLDGDDKISRKIGNSPWFMASWNADPTIKSMLNMLDSLEEHIVEREVSWNSLLSGKITFDYIDIKSDEFRLTDELYIKMNSRGKPLTEFENFKALFSGILAGKNTEYAVVDKIFEKSRISYQDYFAFKIDGQWLDTFWSYRNDVNISVDDSILNFLYFVSEFLFYRNVIKDEKLQRIVPKRDIDFLAKVFSVKENIDFLFDSLDFLSSLSNVPEFFNLLFLNISTFDGYSKDYFLRCLTNTGFEVKDKTILYSVLAYAVRMHPAETDDNFSDYVRIVRNLLIGVRQPNPKKRIEYITNLRLPNVADYCTFIDGFTEAICNNRNLAVYKILSTIQLSGFTKDSIAGEINKAAVIAEDLNLRASIHSLEEDKQVQGNIINFNLTGENTQEKIESFLQIWSGRTENGLLVRALLCQGDYRVKTHEWTRLGSVLYFGSKSNWSRILTAGEKEERKKVSEVLDLFLKAYLKAQGESVNEKLQFMIDQYVSEERDWRYYFITYPLFASNPYEKLNVYSWGNTHFEINQLGNTGKQVLHSYHRNPYEMVLEDLLKNKEQVVRYAGRFTDLSFIEISKKVKMISKGKGWKISLRGGAILDEKLIEKYNMETDGEYFILKEKEKLDRIQVAENFVRDFLDLNK